MISEKDEEGEKNNVHNVESSFSLAESKSR